MAFSSPALAFSSVWARKISKDGSISFISFSCSPSVVGATASRSMSGPCRDPFEHAVLIDAAYSWPHTHQQLCEIHRLVSALIKLIFANARESDGPHIAEIKNLQMGVPVSLSTIMRDTLAIWGCIYVGATELWKLPRISQATASCVSSTSRASTEIGCCESWSFHMAYF